MGKLASLRLELQAEATGDRADNKVVEATGETSGPWEVSSGRLWPKAASCSAQRDVSVVPTADLAGSEILG